MKIGIVSDTFLPNIGGAEMHVYYITKHLINLGHEVEIYTNSKGPIVVEDIKVFRNSSKNFMTTLKSLKKFIHNKDLIHCHYTFYLTTIASYICQKQKIPVVTTLHGLGTLDSSVKYFPQRKLYRKLSFKNSDYIIATSDEMFQLATRFKNENIIKIPNGVNTELFRPEKVLSNKKTKKIILSMRRLNPKNGVQYLIECAPAVIEKSDLNIEFWISGKYKLEDYLKNRVLELGIEDKVKFIGEIRPELTKDYYELSEIVVFPSSAESTSLACLEAMAMGKTIIASALSAYKEMIGENERGYLVNIFDRDYSDYNAPLKISKDKVELLSDAIINLLNDEDARIKYGIKARNFVKENYDWKIIVKNILKVYKSALNDKYQE